MYPGWSPSDVKLYEYCDILMFVSRMVSLWCQTVWILWYSYVCNQDGLPVMSNCINIVMFLCLWAGWPPSDVKLYEYCDILMFVSRMVSQWCQTVWILWYSYVCIQDGLPVMSNCINIVIFLCLYPQWSLSDVKLYEYCDILMFVSRMVSQWCQTVWILWYSYVCIQDGLSVMSNCMNIVIFLCLYPGWSSSDVKLYEYCDILMFVSRMVSQWCQTVWILWYSYVCVQDGLPVMSTCMNIVIFLCLCPRWSLCDVKLYEYGDILMFVSMMVSQWCETVWILWHSNVCIQDGLPVMSNCMNIVIFLCLYREWSLCDVKLYEYCGILMFVTRMVSQWCQTVLILWYSYVCIQDGLPVMSNCVNNVIFLCLCPGWSPSDVKLYEYCDILMFVLRMVPQWCQTVCILWYSYVCIQDGLPVMSNCMNIEVFLCLYPGWSPSDVKLYEYCDILMFVSRMVSQWCQTVWILWYSYVCVQDGLSVMSNCMNIVIFLCLCPGWFLSDVKLYEYCDILMFVSRMVSQWCQTVWILWYSYVCIQDGLCDVKLYEYCDILVCIQDGLSVMSNCMNFVIFLCLCPGWSLSDVKLYEYCDILIFVSRMVSQWCQTVWILWYSYVCIQDGLSVMSNCMNIVIFLCLYPGWSPSDVKMYEYCDILMFVSRMVSQWCQTVWILWFF